MRFRLSPPALALLLTALFLIVNSGAYSGYFSDDDLDNLAWTSFVSIDEFRKGILDVRLSPHNFRPSGHIVYWVMGRLAGLHFLWWVALIQALHLMNATLLWRLLAPGAGEYWALGAAAIWLFHPAILAAHWKPMYVFDVLCALFCLVVAHAWRHKRWILAGIAFWCAYKAKEVALFLPAVVGLYEFTVGHRRVKPLLPLLAISASFGLQAIFVHRESQGDYALRFTPQALWATTSFYVGRLGLTTAALAAFGLARRNAWAAVGFLALMIPLLILPGRLFAVYLYVPMLALGFLIVKALPRMPRFVLAAVLILIAYHDYRAIREFRRAELAAAADRRVYVETLSRFLKASAMEAIVCDGAPMNRWGVEGAIHYLSRKNNPVRWDETARDSEVLLRWNPERRHLEVPGL